MVSVFAQTPAMEMDDLLVSRAVSCRQAAGFVLRAAGVSKSAMADPYGYALTQGWITKKAAPDDKISMDQLALLMMGAFKLDGGILYSVTQSPRYAYRELVYHKVIQGRVWPTSAVPGELLISLVGRLHAIYSLDETPSENDVNALPGAGGE